MLACEAQDIWESLDICGFPEILLECGESSTPAEWFGPSLVIAVLIKALTDIKIYFTEVYIKYLHDINLPCKELALKWIFWEMATQILPFLFSPCPVVGTEIRRGP